MKIFVKIFNLLINAKTWRQINDDLSKKNSKNESIVYPIYNSPLKVSSLLSYSICYDHSVCITKEGTAQAVGDNHHHHQIWDSLPRQMINGWKDFEIQDVYGSSYSPLSVVCGSNYTLYIARKQEDDKSLLFHIAIKTTGFRFF